MAHVKTLGLSTHGLGLRRAASRDVRRTGVGRHPDFPLTKCSNTLVYTNPNPNECVEVHVWNLTSSPPNSSQTVTVAWSTGGSTPTDITPSANPLIIHCYISTIHAHEKQTSHSDHRVTSP